MADRRTVEELSLSELEQLVLTRRREQRLQRMRSMGIERERPDEAAPATFPAAPTPEGATLPPLAPRARRAAPRTPRPSGRRRGQLLTVIEVSALIGFIVLVALWYADTRRTNLVTVGDIPATDAAAAPVEAGLLPGNPAAPAENTPIPALYQDWIQPAEGGGDVPLGDLSDSRPTRIEIPRLKLDAPVVHGDDWEALKRGAGHHVGSANPGERGNMVLSAHNDIFGELFRYLDDLQEGDRFTVYDAADRAYTYVVRTKRIVEPTEVSVLNSSPEPLATLITCYPYLVDSHRLVVQAELER